MAKFEVWEFYGNGDPMFGGTADDRILYKVGDTFQFLRGCDACYRKDIERAKFDSEEAAKAAGVAASTRRGGLISAMVTR